MSNRYIFNVLKSARSELIKQESEKKRLWNSYSTQALTCFRLIPVDISECCPDGSCKDLGTGYQILRSEIKLPTLIDTVHGKIITGVYDLFHNEIEKTTIKDWNITRKRRFRLPNKPKYFIRNDYLYVVDMEADEYDEFSVVVEGIFEETDKVEKLNICSNGEDMTCKSALDYEFSCPGYLERRVFLLTGEEVARKLSIPKDEYNNAKEDLNPGNEIKNR